MEALIKKLADKNDTKKVREGIRRFCFWKNGLMICTSFRSINGAMTMILWWPSGPCFGPVSRVTLMSIKYSFIHFYYSIIFLNRKINSIV